MSSCQSCDHSATLMWYKILFEERKQYQYHSFTLRLKVSETQFIYVQSWKAATGGVLVSACNFIKKETLAQAFSCGFCEFSKNTFFKERLLETATESWTGMVKSSCVVKWTLFYGDNLHLDKKGNENSQQTKLWLFTNRWNAIIIPLRDHTKT